MVKPCVGAVLLLGACLTAQAGDANRHLIFDWTVKAPAEAAFAQPGDICDRINHSSGAAPLTASSVSGRTADYKLPDGTQGTLDPVCVITDQPVKMAVRREETCVPYLHLPQPMTKDGTGKNYFDNQKIVFPKESVKPVREMTVFLRFRWGGGLPGSDRTDIFGYDKSWDPAAGMFVSIGGAGSTAAGYPMVGVGAVNPTSVSTSMWINKDSWTELACSIREFTEDDKTKFEVWAHLCRLDANDGGIVSVCITNTTWKLNYRAEGSRRSYISLQDSTSVSAPSSNIRNFRGDIQRVAVFDKALTKDEVRQVMMGESDDIVLGVENGASGEFAAAGEAAEVFDCDTMPDSLLRKTLDEANPVLELKKSLPEATAAYAHVLRFGVLPNATIPENGEFVKITANGARIGYVKLSPTGETYYVCIPASVMARATASGGVRPFSLRFERQGWKLAGAAELDFLSLGGVWQIGTFDYGSAEFGGADKILYDYCVPANNPKKCSGNLYGNGGGTSYNPLRIRFTVSKDIAEKMDAKLVTSVCEGYKWKIRLNGADYYADFWDTMSDHWTRYSIPFPAGTLREGLNTLELVVPSVSQWTKPDAFRFETVESYPCSLWTGPRLTSGLMLLLK